MNKEIEEMAKVIAKNIYSVNEPNIEFLPNARNASKELYNIGYRKQREWISVDERLPTEDEDKEKILIGIVNGRNIDACFLDARVFVRYDFQNKEWYSEYYDLTNCTVDFWMPLPELSKTEGE